MLLYITWELVLFFKLYCSVRYAISLTLLPGKIREPPGTRLRQSINDKQYQTKIYRKMNTLN